MHLGAALHVERGGGRATGWLSGIMRLSDTCQTPNSIDVLCGSETVGDKLHWSRGKQPRSPVKAPKGVLSGKGCGIAKTARRLA